jgi:hypothetical protein
MPPDRRVATLLAFARVFEATALDDASDVLDALITELSLQAQRISRQERLRTPSRSVRPNERALG